MRSPEISNKLDLLTLKRHDLNGFEQVVARVIFSSWLLGLSTSVVPCTLAGGTEVLLPRRVSSTTLRFFI
jgi:hypothetical protein